MRILFYKDTYNAETNCRELTGLLETEIKSTKQFHVIYDYSTGIYSDELEFLTEDEFNFIKNTIMINRKEI